MTAEKDAATEGTGGAELIFRATIEVLLEVGLKAATTRAVTAQAGVGCGLLNHYFRWPELRASAWAEIFAHVSAHQFPPDQPPDRALERYLSTGFHSDARGYWRLWLEATDLAGSDPVMAARLREANLAMIGGMRDCLLAGDEKGLWQVEDAAGSALRISALYDGLAGMLSAESADLSPAKAEAHLRKAVQLELRPTRGGSAGRGSAVW